MEPPTLEIDELIRAVAVNRTTPHVIFLGAGASITSGVPSAGDCIWRWKREIFVTRNPELEKQFGDVTVSSVRERIQKWLDAHGGYPGPGSNDEYAFYAEACFPIPDDRRQFFQNQVHGARPHVGYRLLALLAEAGLWDSVWTTNFDGLAAKATGDVKVAPVEVGLDSARRVVRPVRKDELLCVSLHGDYRYDALKNLPSEIESQEATLASSLVAKLKSSHCIVVGYSGRDESIMKMFADAYGTPGAGRLYWCGYGREIVSDHVGRLFQIADGAGRVARYVPTHGFDDLLIRIASQCLPQDMRKRADAISGDHAQAREAPKPFQLPARRAPSSLIKSNAFPIECPSELLEATVEGYDQQGAWARLRADIGNRDIVAGLFHRKVLALATVDELKDVFGSRLREPPKRVPIDERELYIQDGVVLNVLTTGLARALADACGLCYGGKSRLWSADCSPHSESVGSVFYDAYDAVSVRLRKLGRRMFMVLTPTVAVQRRDGGAPERSVVADLQKRLRPSLGNKEYNEVFNSWRQRLLGREDAATFEFPRNSGTGFRYKISRLVAFAALTSSRPSIQISDVERKYIAHAGTVYAEPKLLFGSGFGRDFERDEHPIRGMLANRPYDFSLTSRGLEQRVRLAVICPSGDEARLSRFLDQFQHSLSADTKKEYLLDYPGFLRAFGLPLEVPSPGDPLWATCPEPPKSGKLSAAAQELRTGIVQAIKAVSAGSPNVVLVYLPDRWNILAHESEDDGDMTELHDAVKAYGVQHGRCTQFLWESTIRKDYMCEIIWWLALSFYTKSMRIPWVIDGLDEDTAYVGLGFSVDHTAKAGEHILMGCSHLYNARGYGLRYRLSKLDDSRIRHGNPFLSRADARRAGESIRQLFFEAAWRHPRRVVIHKRTPFDREERAGFLDGLSGVEQVDLVEINIESSLRYVTARSAGSGGYQDSIWPVERGTAVLLDETEALVWVHGAAPSVAPRRTYYKGRRTVPAPLRIRRHSGVADLSTLANEILGLSKMDWNSFDLYTQVPATIRSSNEIARIGMLLERFGPLSYDYRLFM